MNLFRHSLRGPVALLAPLAAALILVALPACGQSDAGAAAPAAQAGTAASGSDVAAVVAGETITVDELEENASAALQQVDLQLLQCERQAKTSRYEALNASLQQMVRDSLLEQEAAKAGQSVEEYRAAELESRIPEVTDESVQAFFEENRARIGNRTVEQIGPQIRQYLEQQNRQEAEQAFYGELESKYQVDYRLEPPRIEVAAEGPAKGPADAPVTIVEFSDFECPFCSRVVPTLEQVEANYGDKVRIVFRQFPLAMHANAQKAAEASLCARDQGKFWEMHDAMFEDQKALGVAQLKATAGELGLDAESFAQCLDSGEYADEVQADLRAGAEAGVSGTPALFINGQMVAGAVPYEQLAEVIDAELKRKGVEVPSAGGGSAE
jgi:protein-disulfide isomerase